jgi:hypothetical protein
VAAFRVPGFSFDSKTSSIGLKQTPGHEPETRKLTEKAEEQVITRNGSQVAENNLGDKDSVADAQTGTNKRLAVRLIRN